MSEPISDRRKITRQQVNIAAILRCHRLRRRAIIVDFSLGGLHIDSSIAVVIGERATVELSSGDRLPVQVIWVAGGHFGVRFLVAMTEDHPANLALREAAREYQRLHPSAVAA